MHLPYGGDDEKEDSSVLTADPDAPGPDAGSYTHAEDLGIDNDVDKSHQ